MIPKILSLKGYLDLPFTPTLYLHLQPKENRDTPTPSRETEW